MQDKGGGPMIGCEERGDVIQTFPLMFGKSGSFAAYVVEATDRD